MSNYLLPVQVDRGRGTTVVLLNGLGNNHTSWRFVLDHLDYTQNRVIALDLLGFGQAPKPEVDYTLADHSAAVAATLREVGITGAVIAGHSLGCNIALDLATRCPELVSRLVLLGAPLYRKPPRGGGLRSLLRTEGLYFKIFELVQRSPHAIQEGGRLAEDHVPFVKGMEITEQIWPAYRKSPQNSLIQYEPFQKGVQLQIPALFVNGLLDYFIIRRITTRVRRANREHVRLRRTCGPHELTPAQGRVAGWIFNRLAAEVRTVGGKLSGGFPVHE